MKEFKKLLDCLNKQVAELEALCRQKDAHIHALEKRILELGGIIPSVASNDQEIDQKRNSV